MFAEKWVTVGDLNGQTVSMGGAVAAFGCFASPGIPENIFLIW